MSLLTRFWTVSAGRRRRAGFATVIGATALAAGLAAAVPVAARATPLEPAGASVAQRPERPEALTLTAGGQPRLPNSGIYSRYRDYATGLCVDGNNSSSYTNPCYGGGDTYQDWAYFLTRYSETMQDYQTGRCLDSNYAGNVYTSPCNGNNTYENWTFGGQGPGYTIQNYQTGRCLDSNAGESDYTSPCNWNNNYQNWTPIS